MVVAIVLITPTLQVIKQRHRALHAQVTHPEEGKVEAPGP